MLNMHRVRHQTVAVDGVNLFYREAGQPDAPGLLLLHGDLASSFSFRNIMSPAGAGRTCGRARHAGLRRPHGGARRL